MEQKKAIKYYVIIGFLFMLFTFYFGFIYHIFEGEYFNQNIFYIIFTLPILLVLSIIMLILCYSMLYAFFLAFYFGFFSMSNFIKDEKIDILLNKGMIFYVCLSQLFLISVINLIISIFTKSPFLFNLFTMFKD